MNQTEVMGWGAHDLPSSWRVGLSHQLMFSIFAATDWAASAAWPDLLRLHIVMDSILQIEKEAANSQR